MTKTITEWIADVARLSFVTGPIFGKELRTLSRRRRYYVLRFVYVVFLILVLASAWMQALLFDSSGSATAYKSSRMGWVGKNVAQGLMWFQFLTAQIITVVVLSNSINDEIRRRTLDVLLSTPINSFQIITGKLLSGVLLVVLLICLSLPVLAIIRVFGAVPWDFVVAGLAISFTAVLLTGSLTILLSARILRPYLVIVTMLIILVAAHTASQFAVFAVPGSGFTKAMSLINPTVIILANSMRMFIAKPANVFPWGIHCVAAGIASTALVVLAALLTRRSFVATSLAAGRSARRNALDKIVSALSGRRYAYKGDRALRPVTGSPVLWKELGGRLYGHRKVNIITFGLLFLSFIAVFIFRFTSRTGMYILFFYLQALWLIAAVRIGTMSATTITREKEARTWAILLTTPLDDRRILRDKLTGVVRRNLVLMALLLIVQICSFVGSMYHPGQGWKPLPFDSMLVIPFIRNIIAPLASMVFWVGTGLFFSVRLRSSTAAVVATVSVFLCLLAFSRFILPLLLALFYRFVSPNLYSLLTFVPSAVSLLVGLYLYRQAGQIFRKHIF